MALLHCMQFFVGPVTTIAPARLTCYTVPAGDRIILRSVAVNNHSGTATMHAYVWVNGVGMYTFVLAIGGTAGDSAEWRPWIVLTPGQKIEMAVSAALGVTAVISGSLYTI